MFSFLSPASTVPAASPAPGYVPFDYVPESPAPYVPASFSKHRLPATGDHDPESEPEEGIYVSIEDVAALKRWADERHELQERLAEAEQTASERECEVAELRARLVQVEEALRARQGDAVERPRPKKDRAALRPLPDDGNPRHSDTEIDQLTAQARSMQQQKKRSETDALREEWRNLRAMRAASVGAVAGAQRPAQ